MSIFPPPLIRNFSIIAHIDHGKSTLSDRLLETTHTILHSPETRQVLDKLQVERERGITVKANTASMLYAHSKQTYLLNLIDTPGHVDFHYEVSRSLAACQGALLVVDCVKGVQAQTVANFYAAFEGDLEIIPVLNKIDLPHADVPRVEKQLQTLLDFDPSRMIRISAKTGLGVDALLPAIVERIPPPKGDTNGNLRLRLVDSWFDVYRGVVLLVQVVDGNLFVGNRIYSAHTQRHYEVQELGILHPSPHPLPSLHTGQVGYVIPNMKSSREAYIGDTFFLDSCKDSGIVLEGFKPPKPMVFASLYPVESSDFEKLTVAIEKLTLNDSSVSIRRENSVALGSGYRCGFLGVLHSDIFQQRLQQEYDIDVIATAPQVPFKVYLKSGEERFIESASLFPEPQEILKVEEPIVTATIITPTECLGPVITLCQERRGVQTELSYIDQERALLRYTLPLSEVVIDFFDTLKSMSHGYASLDYEESGYSEARVVRMEILINGKGVDALSTLVLRDRGEERGRGYVQRLKSVIPRQMFEVAIQASLDGKIVARETVKALRKDVTARCYGGDITRRKKLLERQKEGKKAMKRIGNVDLPQEAFVSVLGNDDR